MSAAVLNAIRQQMRHVQTDSGIIYFCTGVWNAVLSTKPFTEKVLETSLNQHSRA